MVDVSAVDTAAPQFGLKYTSGPENDDAVVDLNLLSFAQEKPTFSLPNEEEGPPRALKPGLQLLFRIMFTLLAATYFLLNTKEPLFLDRIAIVALAGLLLVIFTLFHFLMKEGEFFFKGIPLAALLDIAACSVAWMCDPWEPAPMMLFVLITAVGNGANYGYKCLRSLFNIIAPIIVAIFLMRIMETDFSSTGLMFLALSIFVLIYTCLLIRYIDHLQLWAGKKASEFEKSNKSLQKIGDALQGSESRYKNMFEHSGTPTILLEENMVISIVNSKFEQLTGFKKGDLCNKKKLTDFIHKDDLERIQRFHIRRRALGDTAPTEYECQLIDKSQRIKHVIIRLSVAQWHERIIATLVDITSRKQAKAALQQYNIRLQQVARKLKESELRYRSLFENTGTATILVEKNMRITMANSQFCEMTGNSRLVIKDRRRLTEFIERKNLARIRRYHAIQSSRGLPPPNEYELILVGSHRMSKHVVMKAYKPPGQESTIVSFFDITSRKVAEAALAKANEKLQALAVSDELTQVANRRRFDDYLRQEWERHKRDALPLGIIMCDVDSFKLFNDTYGHQAGDDCLKSVAAAIKMNIKRTVDLVARYGGEEFVVVMPNTDTEGAMQVAENIRMGVENLKVIHEKSQASKYVTLSLGVACMIPETQLPPERLVRAADIALYEAKNNGRNRIMTAAKKGKSFAQRPVREDNVIKIS